MWRKHIIELSFAWQAARRSGTFLCGAPAKAVRVHNLTIPNNTRRHAPNNAKVCTPASDFCRIGAKRTRSLRERIPRDTLDGPGDFTSAAVFF